MGNTELLELKWGTQTPILYNDPEYGQLELKIIGICRYKVNNNNIPTENLEQNLYQNIMVCIQKIVSENQNQDYRKIGDIVYKNLTNTLIANLQTQDVTIENVEVKNVGLTDSSMQKVAEVKRNKVTVVKTDEGAKDGQNKCPKCGSTDIAVNVNFVVTSMVFESRNVDLGLSGEAQENVNFHEGWDFAIPIGTNFYSMCNGHVSNIVNTQFNDLSYKQSGNSVGNYITVNCSNGLKVSYLHIQANSSPFGMKVGSLVREGDLLGRTSTTGLSTGPHLHLSLQNSDGTYLDALEYVNFNYKKG